jgi:hypothetical protein
MLKGSNLDGRALEVRVVLDIDEAQLIVELFMNLPLKTVKSELLAPGPLRG